MKDEIQYNCLCERCAKVFLISGSSEPWPVDAEWKGPMLCEACRKGIARYKKALKERKKVKALLIKWLNILKKN